MQILWCTCWQWGQGKNFLKELILIFSWTCSQTWEWKVVVDIQISWSTGCFASVSWWTATGRWTWVAAWQPVVERSIMSWQEGEGSDVLACPDRPAPVSLMRLPVTGDVVVRTCAGVDFHRVWTSASLAWLPQLKCLLCLLCFCFICLFVFSEKTPHAVVFISLRLGRGFVFCCSSKQFTSDICTAAVPLASKSRKLPQSCKSLVPVWVHQKTLCINNSVTSPSQMSFSPPVCFPVSQTLSPLPLKPPTHLPFPMWGY